MLYVIADIHGFHGALDRALALIAADGGSDAPVIFLGDYVDRGPDSGRVIDRIMGGMLAGRNWRALRGNHDRMFHRFVTQGIQNDPAIKSGKGWLHPALGGPATLASYMPNLVLDHPDWPGLAAFKAEGLDGADPELIAALVRTARAIVPRSHLDWVASRPLWIEEAGHVFVHAGIRPGVPMAEQDEDDLIWIRDGWVDSTADHGFMVVHGHTALDHPRHEGNRINLDGGAGYGRPLVPAVFDGTGWHTLTDAGRVPLTPEN